MKKKTAGLIAIVMIASVVFFAGCVEKNQVDVAQVREYADPITENILLGMNEGNYTKYSEHFDQTMKNAMPEAVFNETNALIKSKIGDYILKEFWKVESKDQFAIAYYKAKFTQEPEDVIVKVVFQEIVGEMKVSGLWLDSPKLRKK
uniref:DUF3887 domain-containing protein n=1 Tax=Candidatus Methanophagaceae archaeon ANME-1 ERB6 TaxID=2759912 RepID=A0A7G9YSD5_9EURY|nr:hypothetical protein LELLBOIK_00034 [Methanosarcinales archaeon ANME-1 ERB6]